MNTNQIGQNKNNKKKQEMLKFQQNNNGQINK